jgi:hypothetical protein
MNCIPSWNVKVNNDSVIEQSFSFNKNTLEYLVEGFECPTSWNKVKIKIKNFFI